MRIEKNTKKQVRLTVDPRQGTERQFQDKSNSRIFVTVP